MGLGGAEIEPMDERGSGTLQESVGEGDRLVPVRLRSSCKDHPNSYAEEGEAGLLEGKTVDGAEDEGESVEVDWERSGEGGSARNAYSVERRSGR